ncbi:glycosyltransferase, partial [Patescibacteria group bacterium]|nr:glycosyltransferase [Patescibacteria group bacterium]
MKTKPKTIVFSGGGTGGSVTPLLAVIKDLKTKHPDWNMLWFGSTHGIEKEMVKKESIKYYPILSGKFRRYFSVKNFLDIFNILAGFIQSFIYLALIRPKVVISAGSFVSVP